MIRSSLFLAIHSKDLTIYKLSRIEAGWQLEKEDGTIYHVVRRQGRLSCDCRDFLHRKEDIQGSCKHMAALTEAGLL